MKLTHIQNLKDYGWELKPDDFFCALEGVSAPIDFFCVFG
jgi:hypothetical protein